jgi:hypothetical protein
MDTNLAAWVAGYRLGHDGQPPALSKEMLEQELLDIESDKRREDPLRYVDPSGHDWLSHLQGWAVGQAFAAHQIGKP